MPILYWRFGRLLIECPRLFKVIWKTGLILHISFTAKIKLTDKNAVLRNWPMIILFFKLLEQQSIRITGSRNKSNTFFNLNCFDCCTATSKRDSTSKWVEHFSMAKNRPLVSAAALVPSRREEEQHSSFSRIGTLTAKPLHKSSVSYNMYKTGLRGLWCDATK